MDLKGKRMLCLMVAIMGVSSTYGEPGQGVAEPDKHRIGGVRVRDNEVTGKGDIDTGQQAIINHGETGQN